MSTQSVIHNSDNKISIQINNYYKKLGKQYLLHNRFDIGDDVDVDSILYINRLEKIFCQDYCSIDKKDITTVKEKINIKLIHNISEL